MINAKVCLKNSEKKIVESIEALILLRKTKLKTIYKSVKLIFFSHENIETLSIE